MKLVDIEQRTDKWLNWRKLGITASEASVIMKSSPYKGPWELYMQRKGKITPPDLSGNRSVQRGIKFEPHIRNRLREKYGALADVCGEWDENPVFRASFDGLDTSNRPHEIKVSGDRVFWELQTKKEDGKTYKMYRWQVVHQCLVSGSKVGFLHIANLVSGARVGKKAAMEAPLITFEITPTEEEFDALKKEGAEFWRRLQNNAPPAPLVESDKKLQQKYASARMHVFWIGVIAAAILLLVLLA